MDSTYELHRVLAANETKRKVILRYYMVIVIVLFH